jgi:hypothetical protein
MFAVATAVQAHGRMVRLCLWLAGPLGNLDPAADTGTFTRPPTPGIFCAIFNCCDSLTYSGSGSSR